MAIPAINSPFLNYVNNKITEKVGPFTPIAPVPQNGEVRNPPSLATLAAAKAFFVPGQNRVPANFDSLPADVQEKVLNTCNFNQWVAIRRQVSPNTVRTLDIEILRRRHLSTVFDRIPGANRDQKLFNHFFNQFVATASPEEIKRMIELDGNDQFRTKAYALSGWEKTARLVHKVVSHPIVVFPAIIVLSVVSYKVARNGIRVYNELLLPLGIAAAETHLNPRVWKAMKDVYENRWKFFILGIIVELGTLRLPQRVQTYVKPVAKVLCFPVNFIRNVTNRLFWLPLQAAWMAGSYGYQASTHVNKVVLAGANAGERAHLADGIAHARNRFIQDMSSLRAPAAAAA